MPYFQAVGVVCPGGHLLERARWETASATSQSFGVLFPFLLFEEVVVSIYVFFDPIVS